MRDDQPARHPKLRALGTLFAVLAIAAAGAVWSGCGGSNDETGTVREQAEKQVEEGTKKAEEAIEEGTKKAEEGVEKTKKGLEEAQEEIEKSAKGKTGKKLEKALEEGQGKAEKGLEEAKEKAEKYLP